MPSRAFPLVLLPVILVLAVTTATWLLSGVPANDVVLFAAYELVFVAVPGALLLWVLRRRRQGLLITVAIGWPLGHALEILAFSATAAFGARWLYLTYPLIVAAPCAFLLWRRRAFVRHSPQGASMSGRLVWAAGVTLSVGVVYIALMFLPKTPLPSSHASVSYSPDLVYQISKIAEALYHWSATNPGLSGVPLPYEWFVFFHMAAVSQVTHISIPMLALRLDVLPLIIILGCQLLVVGRALSGTAWTGLVAMIVVLLLGALDLTTDASGASPFFSDFNDHLWDSWTFPFGLIFFLALVYLINERLRSATWRTRVDIGSWVLVALLMVGAAGAKATVLPVLIVGTGLYGVVSSVACRSLPSAAVQLLLVLEVVVFLATYFVVYQGGAAYTGIDPLRSLGNTLPVVDANAIPIPVVRAVALPFAYIAGLGGMLLPLAGALYMLRSRHRQRLRAYALCLCMFGGGLLIANLVHQQGYSELYFQDTGYVAGAIVAADGLRLGWLDSGIALPISRGGVVFALAGWVGVLSVLVIAASRDGSALALTGYLYVAFVIGCAGFVAVCALRARERRLPTTGVAALALIPLLAASVLTTPLEVAPAVGRLLDGSQLTPPQVSAQPDRGLTPGLLAALDWLQAHSSVNAILAVNNHWIDSAQNESLYYYYSAFSERQVFIEGYDPVRYQVSPHTAASANLAYRKILNDAVFVDADPVALRTLTQQYAVRFLFIDHVNGGADLAVMQLGTVVYNTASATIVAVG